MTEANNLYTEEQRLRDALVEAAMKWADSLPNPRLDVSAEAECRLENCIFALHAYRSRQSLAVPVCDALPCPFCGAVPADIEEYHGHYHKIATWCVNCTTCDVAIYGKGREGAIARWNSRHASADAEKVEPTDEQIARWYDEHRKEFWDGPSWAGSLIRAALSHFKSPPPRRISDEEIEAEIAHQFGDMDNRTSRKAAHKAVRAIIERVTG